MATGADGVGIFAVEIPAPVLLLGVIAGMAYGLLAVGLVLVHRTSRTINLAHGETGAFGAAILVLAARQWNLPYAVAFVIAIAGAAGTAALMEVAVVRRLRHAPRLIGMIATLGFAELLPPLGRALTSDLGGQAVLPQPPWVPTFDVGALRVNPSSTAVLLLAPAVLAALALFLRRARLGLALRAAADSADSAATVGIPSGRMSSLTWAIAGALAAFTAILGSSASGLGAGAGALGPSLLLRALAAGVLARMTSLPLALAAGVGIGVVEQVLRWNNASQGVAELGLGLVILAALALQRAAEGRSRERGSWAVVRPWPVIDDVDPAAPVVRRVRRAAGAVAILAAVLVPAVVSNQTIVVLTTVTAWALVALSVGVVTGLAGRLSLGQFALAGIGATASALVVRETANFALAFAVAAVLAGAMSIAVGSAGLRLGGNALTVTSLALAVAVPAWVLPQTWALGDGVTTARPVIAGVALDGSKEYYRFALAVLLLGVLACRNLRTGGLGRALVALRDNEPAARAFGVRRTTSVVQALGVAGALAGLGGAVLAHALSRIAPSHFPATAGFAVVAAAVIGGLGTLVGPLAGALYIRGVPDLVDLDAAGLAGSAFGWLVLVLYVPAGLVALARPARDALVRRARAAEPPAEASRTEPERVSARGHRTGTPPDGIVLRVAGLDKRFDGIRAVADVSFELHHGEMLGLIGPNGAGKTTVLDVVSGFERPDAGTVELFGRDAGHLDVEGRTRLGLTRSFQDGALFPTMTVLDVLRLANERREPTRFVVSMLGGRAPERRRTSRARELVEAFGLERWRMSPVAELSTGTRRIVELAAVVALEPEVVLLDEPSAGISAAETEALAPLLLRVREDLGASVVVVDHDLGLVRAVADRIVAMAAGSVLAVGDPTAVLTDPSVVAAYTGRRIEGARP